MSVLKADVVRKVLKKKGFVPESGRQRHVRYYFEDNGEVAAVKTHMSHNDQDVNDFLQSQMAAQLRMSKAEFLEMISCAVDHEDLAKMYRERGLF
ncbi:hypothetical protein [Methanorbis rubei]|uniref:Type II toxin-antitoxin system HicA family toxin n=1 Tax=Methanorbis rubei TaxID=3028300 RepID=A0AAE4SB13_9EURY|nr:hypothetical protein [Methanocorpusculaceae archaeon Cs1]